MNASAIWGEPVREAMLPLRNDNWSWYKENDHPIHRELRSFMQQEIDFWKPDAIVVYERKGTAIFRCLTESRRDPLAWPLTKVVSSSALDDLPKELLRKGRLLVFDDMVRTGKQLNKVAEILYKGRTVKRLDGVRFIAFAVHEDAAERPIAVHDDATDLRICDRPLDSWFYRDLTSQAYANIRERIVRLLQSEGSLMLDTEHLEVRITVRGGFNRLMHALRRKATPLEFRSGGDRTNITIYYGDDPSHQLPTQWFPKGTGFTDIVKKCRIVQRENPDEFAIIPICLPAVPIKSKWPNRPEDIRMLGDIVLDQKTGRKLKPNEEPSRSRFYAAALLGSLQSLEWILKDLYAADPNGFGIRYPSYSSDPITDVNYSLQHLQVMYPTLDVDTLVERVIRVGKEAESFGHKRGDKGPQARQPRVTFSNDELHEKAMELLQVIRHALDQRRAELAVQFDDPSLSNPGLRAKEVFDLAKRLDWDLRGRAEWLPAAISTLFDILIDDAKLVTRVEAFPDESGNQRWTRTFKPDGEIVSDLVRDYTAQWGLPRGF
jgi:hypothetical protein